MLKGVERRQCRITTVLEMTGSSGGSGCASAQVAAASKKAAVIMTAAAASVVVIVLLVLLAPLASVAKLLGTQRAYRGPHCL